MVGLHEAALKWMFNMPRIWLDYAEFAASIHDLALTRQIYDRCLQTLPVTQHKAVWLSYIRFAEDVMAAIDDEDGAEL